MRIAIDARVLMDARYSGVVEYARQLLAALFRLDKKNEYVLYYNSFRDVSGRLPDFGAPNARYRSTGWPNKAYNYLLTRLLKRPRLDKLCGADTVFLPHINFAAFSPAARVVLAVHDLSFLRFPGFYSRRKRFWHAALCLKGLARRADTVVAISRSTRDDIISLLGLPEERVKVVYSAAGPEFRPLPAGDPALDSVRAKYGLGRDFILCLGTLEPRKNFEGAIAAFDALLAKRPDLAGLELAIAGAPGWMYRPIYGARSASPNRERIRMLGYVDDRDRNALYNAAAVFLYPSFYEGFGLPPLEAMAAGTPVVAGNLSSLPEVTGDAGLLADPYDSNDLALALEALLTDSSLRADLSERGLARAKRFSWDKAAGEYLGILENR